MTDYTTWYKRQTCHMDPQIKVICWGKLGFCIFVHTWRNAQHSNIYVGIGETTPTSVQSKEKFLTCPTSAAIQAMGPLSRNARSYLRASSLHGLRYVEDGGLHPAARAAWAAAVAASFCLAGALFSSSVRSARRERFWRGKHVILLYYEERRGRGVTRLTPHSEFIGRDEPLYNLSPPLGITPDH